MRAFPAGASRRRRRALLWLLPMALAAVALTSPAEARDRPGTPNQEALYVCDHPAPGFAPVLCATFNNTASETVRFEIETTRNGQPYALDPNTFNCKNVHTRQVFATDAGGNQVPTGRYVASGEICYVSGKTYTHRRDTPDPLYVFETLPVDWNTQYCMRFRARRASDSVVSERWSNFACQNVPPQPAAPTRPDFSFAFAGSQMYGQSSGAGAKPGQTAQVIPAKLIVTPTVAAEGAILYRVTLDGAQMQEWRPSAAPAPHTFNIPGSAQTVSVELCGYNFTGHRCMARTLNVLEQGAQPRPGLNPADIGAKPYSTPRPVRMTGAAKTRGAGTPVTIAETQPLNATFMPGVDMPGNDYSSKPISGNAVDCQNMCTADGKCLSWTWVKAGVQNAQAMCWLKNAVPPQRQNANTTSGIKAGGTPAPK